MSVTNEEVSESWNSSPPPKKLSLSPMHTRRYFKSPITTEETKRLIEFLESKEFTSVNHQLILKKDIRTYLNNLNHLNLSENSLSTLPSSLLILGNLEDLNLSKNLFTEVPNVILNIKPLKKLSLNDNSITELPSLNVLTNLETLNVSKNKLTDLPSSFASMDQLKTLDLSSNSLKSLPKCLQRGLINLEHLDVSGNIRLNLNSSIKSRKLRKFIAKDISFCFNFPRWLLSGKFSIFEEVNFSRTKFEKIFLPSATKKTMVKKLNLKNCSLNCYQLQKILSNVVGLRTLKIGNKDFFKTRNNMIDQRALHFLINPEELLELQMRSTDLSLMPIEIERFQDLRKIDVGNNHLTWLPEEFCNLNMLEILILDNNSLISLPEDIGKLRGLREFRAAGNGISRLPKSFKELRRLEILDLYDNQFSEAPQGVDGYEGLIAFDFEMNYVCSGEIKLTKTSYELLKKMMRGSRGNYRMDGLKFETPTASPSSNHCESDWELPKDSPIIEATMPSELEDWDEPEDSSDEFDPYNPQPPRIKVKFTYLDHLKPRFCPNDIHPLPMMQRIAIARANGDYQPVPDPVDGQFSDA